MDVQTENTDPPPCESQPSGKIRKGFKLFGKRKPGSIFSIRNKGDGNNKSPVNRSKTLDGLSESGSPESEQDPDKERGHEVSQGEGEPVEEEPHREDGVLAAARNSISSASSAKSLSFLSLLRGGRRGVGDRRVQTVSQPVGRQRRGLKGLFGTVRFKSKDKEDKDEGPPSPLLMSSRANSVEIIKEDLTLTPKAQPRSLNSPDTESSEPDKSVTSQDTSTASPSTESPQIKAGEVSKTNEHVPPLPSPGSPIVPGDKSLSTLLADISSLLTFDSISGGGDIMADVEAEWGKASRGVSPVLPEVTVPSTSIFSKPAFTSALASTSVEKTPKAAPTTVSTFMTKPILSSSPVAKPSSIITTLTKSSTLTTSSVKLSSDSAPTCEPSARITIKSTPAAASMTKPLTTPVTLTSFSAPIMSSPAIIMKSTASVTSVTMAPLYTPATVVKAPSVSPSLSSTIGKVASETTAPPQTTVPGSKPSPIATPNLISVKPPPATESPPTPVSLTKPAPLTLHSASSFNVQISTFSKPSQSSAVGEPKASTAFDKPVTVTTQASSLAPVFRSTTTTATSLTPSPAAISSAPSKPAFSLADSKRTIPACVNAPDLPPSTVQVAIAKTQPSTTTVPAGFSTFSEKIPAVTKPTPAPVTLDKKPPAPTMPTSAVVTTASPKPTAQIPVSEPKPHQVLAPTPASLSKECTVPAQTQVSKDPFTPSCIPVSVSKDPPSPRIPVSVSKDPPSPRIPVSVSKEPPAPAHIRVSVAKEPPAPDHIPVSVSKVVPGPAHAPVYVPKEPPAPAYIPVSVLKEPPAPAYIPMSVTKEPPTPAYIPVSVPKEPPTPAYIPVSVPKEPPAPAPAPAHIPVSVPKEPPAPAHIPISVPKDAPAPVRIPVSVSKESPATSHIPVAISADPPAPPCIPASVSTTARIPVSVSKEPPAPVSIPVSAPQNALASARIPASVSQDASAPVRIPVSVPQDPPAPARIPVSLPQDPPAPVRIPVSVPQDPPAPARIPVSQSMEPSVPAHLPVSLSKSSPVPAVTPVSQSKAAPCSFTSPPTTLTPLPSEVPVSAKMNRNEHTSLDGQLPIVAGANGQGAQTAPPKREEMHNESRTSLQGPSRERRTPQSKSSGLSKIPVVGGGRAGKLPVREREHADDDRGRDPPTPVLEEERPHFYSHDTGSKDKIINVEANVATSKHTQEESQQPPQPKVLTSLPRDSKIPVKHGPQSHTASHIPQAKEPPRTKIPVSKVPVRRFTNKPAAAAGNAQIRK